MAKERLPMRKIREILRLRWAQGRSVRETALSVGVSTGVVSKLTSRATLAGLDWASVEGIEDDRTLEERLYGREVPLSQTRPEPNPAEMHIELKKPGVTLELLHLEYLQAYPTGLKYTAFCERYRRWKKRRGVTMRQEHKAGEKAFVDFSGKRPCIVNPKTGELEAVELFVAVLGASNYSYAEASASQKLPDWLRVSVNAFEFFEGVPEVTVPDQLRSAVAVPSREEPVLTRSYADLGRHYSTAIVPARPGKPRDKAKVEVGVQVAQRWILARLRHETHFSLESLNARIAELVDDLNARPMKHLGGVTRAELYEKIEKPALRPLPERRYEHAEWRLARVNLDYHIQVFDHFYSVPFALVREEVDVRVSATIVEVFHRGQRVASHHRSHVRFGHTTQREHGPVNHQAWAASDPGLLLEWAASVGPCTEAMMRRILESNPRREQVWRSGRALKRVGETYGPQRTEVACERALRFGAVSYKPIQNILKRELDLVPHPDDADAASDPIHHEQVRGPDYYQH